MHGVAVAVDGGDELTYGEWDARSAAVARGLAARGVGVGDRVALLFDPSGWVDFAVAHRAVRTAGAVAVLLSPGAARPDLLRSLSHAGAIGLLGAARLVPPGISAWTAHPDDVGRGFDAGALDPAPADPEAPAELIYPSAPLSPPRPVARSHRDLAEDPGVAAGGWLVHTWAPGSLAGQSLLARPGGGAVALAVFDPDRLGGLVEGKRAATLALTPALAAALVASDAPRRHDLSSVRRVVLSGSPSPGLRASLGAAFPGAEIGEIGGPPAAGAPLPPVAASQEPMLWHEQFAAGSFNLPCLVRRYEGPLDVAALGRAFSELARRHQPLRSTFALIDGVPRQVVHDDPVQMLEVVDFSEREDEVAGLLSDASSRPFDLVAGPLFEPRLVRLGPDDHLLVVRLHHTVFDDWSVDVFRRELSALYASELSGAPSPLTEPQISFADFARRQQARLASGRGADERAWWRKELDGAPLAVQLAIGPGRPQPGEPLRLDLPPSLVADLRALAPRLRATPFMTVLAAFSVLLARATGQDDLVLATVVAHRNTSDVEPLVGCFTKKVPLRLRVDGDPTFPELVARTRGSLLGALSHQGLAFDAAVQEALGRPAADHGVVPQVAVVFQGEAPRQVNLSMPGLVTSRYEPPVDSRRERHFSSGAEEAWGDGIYLKTFLILSLLEGPQEMALVARGVFDRPRGRRLLEDFHSLLADVVADPLRLVSELRAGAPPPPAGEDASGRRPGIDLVELRGFQARRSRIVAALARCPGVREVEVGVRDVEGEPRLVASVVPGGEAPPTLAQLRRSLWAQLPGALWPADAPVLAPDPDPGAVLLAAMWAESSGKDVGPDSIYWQDFSFLAVLAEAREAGVAITDEQVVHCRTPAMLAAAMAAAGPAPPRIGGGEDGTVRS